MDSRTTWRQAWPYLFALLSLVLIFAFAAWFERGLSDESESEPTRTTARAEQQKSPLAVFIGDEYTSGSSSGGIGARGYPAIVSERLGWRHRTLAEAGTGYRTASDGSTPFAEKVPSAIDQAPEIVIVLGSRNDREPDAVREWSGRVFRRLRKFLPNAALVAVGPPSIERVPTARIRALNEAVEMGAGSAERVTFISPLEDRWFDEGSARLVSSNRRPTNAGHEHMARLRERQVRRRNVPAGRSE